MAILAGVLFGTISLIFFGLSDYWGALPSRKIGPFEAAMLVRIIGLIPLLVIFFLLSYQIPALSLYNLEIIALTSIFLIGAVVSYYKSTVVGNISIVTAIANSWAVVTVILSAIFLNYTFTKLNLTSIVLIILGTVLVSFRIKEILKLKIKKLERGFHYAIFAMMGWGIGYFLTNLLVMQLSWFLPQLFVTITMVVFYLVYNRAAGIKYVSTKPVILIVLLNGLINIGAWVAYSLGVNSPSASIVAPIAAASPAVTILLAVLRQKEKLEINHITGMVMIIVGLVALSI